MDGLGYILDGSTSFSFNSRIMELQIFLLHLLKTGLTEWLTVTSVEYHAKYGDDMQKSI
jgi:hypothetical protein